jgi:predicted DsbA family dithiol-disulfide isomerase
MHDPSLQVPALLVHSDVLCPWSTVIVLRLLAARARAGADDVLPIVHRAMPLELVHERPVARRVVDAEIPLCASLTPDFGWTLWQGRSEEYPVTSLLALEAVAAASGQSLLAGEQLDLALRRAFFTRSRCVSMRHEILAAAGTCDAVDVSQLGDALDQGTFRATLSRQYAEARAAGVPCSGTVTLPDGTMLCNPGTEVRWIGGPLPAGTPVLDSDVPATYDAVVATALRAVAIAGDRVGAGSH